MHRQIDQLPSSKQDATTLTMTGVGIFSKVHGSEERIAFAFPLCISYFRHACARFCRVSSRRKKSADCNFPKQKNDSLVAAPSDALPQNSLRSVNEDQLARKTISDVALCEQSRIDGRREGQIVSAQVSTGAARPTDLKLATRSQPSFSEPASELNSQNDVDSRKEDPAASVDKYTQCNSETNSPLNGRIKNRIPVMPDNSPADPSTSPPSSTHHVTPTDRNLHTKSSLHQPSPRKNISPCPNRFIPLNRPLFISRNNLRPGQLSLLRRSVAGPRVPRSKNLPAEMDKNNKNNKNNSNNNQKNNKNENKINDNKNNPQCVSEKKKKGPDEPIGKDPSDSIDTGPSKVNQSSRTNDRITQRSVDMSAIQQFRNNPKSVIKRPLSYRALNRKVSPREGITCSTGARFRSSPPIRASSTANRVTSDWDSPRSTERPVWRQTASGPRRLMTTIRRIGPNNSRIDSTQQTSTSSNRCPSKQPVEPKQEDVGQTSGDSELETKTSVKSRLSGRSEYPFSNCTSAYLDRRPRDRAISETQRDDSNDTEPAENGNKRNLERRSPGRSTADVITDISRSDLRTNLKSSNSDRGTQSICVTSSASVERPPTSISLEKLSGRGSSKEHSNNQGESRDDDTISTFDAVPQLFNQSRLPHWSTEFIFPK